MQLPSRKWISTQVVALTALATMWATTGAWDQEETIGAIGLVSQAALGYLVPNTAGNPESSQAGYSAVEVLLIVFLVLVVLWALVYLF